MDNLKIGAFIAEKRKEKGLTQLELADKLSVTDQAISKWERGKGLPDVSLMQPLCEALGICLSDLLNGEKVQEQEKLTIVLVESLVTAIVYMESIPRMIGTIISGAVIFVACQLIAMMIDRDTGYFECRHCNTPFTKRRFKCPDCKKWSWSKTVKP